MGIWNVSHLQHKPFTSELKNKMYTNEIQRILEKLRRIIGNGVNISFGRVSKTDEILIGQMYDVQYKECSRRGGGFIFMCAYNSKSGGGVLHNAPHQEVLKMMLYDYVAIIKNLRETRAPCKKRRMGFTEPRNLAINASHDLRIKIDDQWVHLNELIPTSVRELNSAAVQLWLNEPGTEVDFLQVSRDFISMM